VSYELKMKVGWLGHSDPEHKREERLKVEEDGKSAWFPLVKDAHGDFIPTGRTEQHFIEVASVDLCKIYDTATYEVAVKSLIDGKKTANVKNVIKWFSGKEELSEDCYGAMPTAVPLKKVIAALRKDVQADDYRRFKWALALLESIEATQEGNREMVVLFYGY
jgi:hypothetical protein